MRWTLLKAYEQAKRVKVKLCEESAEELKKQPNELGYYADISIISHLA